MINWYKKLNLRWRLSILITSVAIYTAVAIAVSVYSLWTQQIRVQVNEQLQRNTELAVAGVAQQLEYEQHNLKAWAQLDIMVDIVSDDLDKRIYNTLQLLKQNYRLPGDLLLVNAEHKIIATTNPAIEEVAKYTNALSIEGDLALDSQIVIRAPVELSIFPDSVSGYLVLTHPWLAVVEKLSSPLPEYLVAYENKLFHVNREGIYLAVEQSQTRFEQENWLVNGIEKLHSQPFQLFRIGANPVSIQGIVNKAEAFKPVNNALSLIGMVTLLLLLPISLIGIYSSNRFLKPIIELQRVAEKIAESGDLNTRIPVQSSDEIGRLATILNKMTQRLQKSFLANEQSNQELKLLTANLEIRVDERTRKLSETLEQLKTAQSQLVQSEKMSSLGQLVAGIAHELNNPISSVYVNTPMLKDYVADMVDLIDFIVVQTEGNNDWIIDKQQDIDFEFLRKDIVELLNAQQDAAKRIRDIVLSLRTFSRLDEAAIKSVDLNKGIDSTLSILRHEIKHRVVVHKDYQLQPMVECFPGEINQVILNLLANAAQAIAGEGNIWISTYQQEQTACIEIKDDGSGVPQGIIDKIFDPFFTTKPIGEGTGLGLSITYSIIEKHHGQIWVENIEPHGARFKITLPLKQDLKHV